MTYAAALPKTVTVFGATGFVGRSVVAHLAKQGYRVRAAMRKPERAYDLVQLGDVGQVTIMQANIRYPQSIARAIKGSDAVINLVGILAQSGKQTFKDIQERGAISVAEHCKNAGLSLVHVSAIGADSNSPSIYASTKGNAENSILELLGEDAILMRPSIIFGPKDNFFNQFANMATLAPALPLIGGGVTKFQPVFVGDVAQAIGKAVAGELKGGSIYELGGSEVLTFKQCLETVLDITERKRLLISIPWWVAKIQGTILQHLPGKLLTSDQVLLLQSDNIVSESAKEEGRTLQAMGITPATVSAILPTYLWRFREFGQYRQPHANPHDYS